MADVQGSLPVRIEDTTGANQAPVTNAGGLGTNILQIGSNTVVTGGTNGSLGVGGLAASGASAAGNPVEIGGTFNTAQPTVTTGQAVTLQATARGAFIIAGGLDAIPNQSGALYPVATATGFIATTNFTQTIASLAQTTTIPASLFDAKQVTIVIANVGTGQSINAASLIFTDTVGGQTATITYAFSAVSIASGANQSFNVNLTNGFLKTMQVSCTFAVATSAGSVTIQTTVNGPGGAGSAGGAASNVNLNQVGGNATVTAGVNGLLAVGGPAASGATASGDPVMVGGVFNTTQPTVTTGQVVDLQATARGALIVASGVDAINVTPAANSSINLNQIGGNAVVTGGTNGSLGVGGLAASGATAVGNPSMVGGVFNTTPPTVTNGQVVDLQATARGALQVAVMEIDNSGIVANYQTAANITNTSTSTLTYTTTSGKTLYLKQVIASASSGPCKVVIQAPGVTNVLAAFFSDASPYINIVFAQPIAIASTQTVNALITNRSGQTQDLYAFFGGHEV